MIDIANFLEWVIHRLTAIALILVVISYALNSQKAGIGMQVMGAVAGAAVINLFTWLMTRLAKSFQH